ncbi:MAG: hypothetical protein KDD66_10395 [Bdellovibrionales bacterium]|nr:hypothetical protein [Bdellovibrionales bacterium]
MSAVEIDARDLESGWATFLGGSVVPADSRLDRMGVDVIFDGTLHAQVKSSITGAIDHLRQKLSLLGRGRSVSWQAVLVGSPDGVTPDEVRESIHRFGAWVPSDTPDRQRVLDGMAQMRRMFE